MYLTTPIKHGALAAAVILMLSGLVSCGNVKLFSIPAENAISASDREGILYNLPKNLLKVEVTYTVYEPRVMSNGVDSRAGEPAMITMETPLTVSTIVVPDEEQAFVLKQDRFSDDLFITSTISSKLTNEGLLLAVDADVEDKTIEVGEALLISAAKIAKTVAAPIPLVPSSDGDPNGKQAFSQADIDAQEAYHDQLMAQIVQLQKNRVAVTDKVKLEVLNSQIAETQKLLAWHLERNRTYQKKHEVKYTVIIDPQTKYAGMEGVTTDTSQSADGALCIIDHTIQPTHLFKELGPVSETPRVTLRISIAHDRITNSGAEDRKGLVGKDKRIAGIVTRTPWAANVELGIATADGKPAMIGNNVAYLPQLGDMTSLPVVAKRGGKVKTKLVFDQAKGTLTEYSVEKGSPAEKAAAATSKVTDSTVEAYDYLKYDKAKKELELQKQLKDLKASLADDPAPSDFDNQLQSLEQQQQLLDMMLKIKDLEAKIKALEKP
jgi:hypothetical protein